MLVAKQEGNYRYFPSTGGSPFCNGVVADPGYEIVRATLERPIQWRAGFQLIDEYLKALGRPRQALCGLELRCSAPYTQEGFIEFNAEYGAVLREWGLNEGAVGTGSTARTNIAPGYHAPGEQVMFAFTYTIPSISDRPTFVVSGTPPGTVRRGEATADANREQVARIVEILEERLNELGVSWDLTSDLVVYAPRNLEPVLRAELLPKIGRAVLNGIRWSPGCAPVGGGGIEIGTYGLRQELRIPVQQA
jgi:hypothetical protein